jgi:hypothetical protein
MTKTAPPINRGGRPRVHRDGRVEPMAIAVTQRQRQVVEEAAGSHGVSVSHAMRTIISATENHLGELIAAGDDDQYWQQLDTGIKLAEMMRQRGWSDEQILVFTAKVLKEIEAEETVAPPEAAG